MKILYIGNERRDAQTVARSLRGITQNVPLAWTQSLDQCSRYLAQNRDLAALVIDAPIHAGKWPSSLKDLRSFPLRPAIVVVVPQGTPPTFDSQAPPPDDFVINGQTFSDDLPIAVSRAVARVRGSQTPSTVPNNTEQRPARVTPEQAVDALFLDPKPTAQPELEQKLANLTAALQHAERRHTAAMAAAQAAHELAATEQLTGQERDFQAQMALERDKRRTIEEMLSSATSAREEAERRCASALTDAAAQSRELQRLTQREAELVAQSQSERAMRAGLEQQILKADAHGRELQQRYDETLKAAGEFAEQRAHFDRELSRIALEGDQLRERLMKAELDLAEARHDRERAAAEAARFTRREADLSAQLTNVQNNLRAVENHLSDAARELEETRQSAARDRAEAVERQASFEALLASERLEYDKQLAGMRSECERLGQACAAANEDVQRLNADLSDAKRVIEVTRREFQETLGHQSAEHATAVAALAAQIAERDERLKEEALRHEAALHASEAARAELHECLDAALAAGRHDIEQVQEALMATLEAVRATKRQQDVLQAKADHLADPAHEPRARAVQQPDIAAWQQLSKDEALV